MRTRLFSTIIVLLVICCTIITISAPAEIVLIKGLELGRYINNGRRIPDKGGNSFIILEQYENNCGPTSAEMLLHYYGISATLADVWREGGISNVDFGTFPGELKQALNRLGIPTRLLNHSSKYYDNPHDSLKRKIRENRPPIVLLRVGKSAYHYVVVVGYDGWGYLIADPNGDFYWMNKIEFGNRWGLVFTEEALNIGGAFVSAAGFLVKAQPYTMISPDVAPTGHFPHLWAQMQGFELAGKVKFFGKRRNWTRTVTFTPPIDLYQWSLLKPLQWNLLKGISAQLGHVSVSNSTQIGDSQIKLEGQVEDAWLTQGYGWVIVRAFSKTRPLIPSRFTVSGVASGDRIPSGDEKTITVTVYTEDGRGVPAAKVRVFDTDDKEIEIVERAYGYRETSVHGKRSFTLRTGGSGDADLTVQVQGLDEKKIKFKVVPREYFFQRRWTHEGTSQLACFGWWYKQDQSWTKYVDVPAGTIKSSVIVREISRSTDRWAKRKNWKDQRGAYMTDWKWWDADTVKVWGKITNGACWNDPNWVIFEVQAKFIGTAPERVGAGAPSLTSEFDTLPEYWQDLSQVPLETDLLTNYPNPFNPETWIPYQLADAAEVEISIYAADGKLVRSLSLGHQPEGTYTSRSRAAHWDGKNEFGEPVASGIYFYTLTAGEFIATRKMLILK